MFYLWVDRYRKLMITPGSFWWADCHIFLLVKPVEILEYCSTERGILRADGSGV